MKRFFCCLWENSDVARSETQFIRVDDAKLEKKNPIESEVEASKSFDGLDIEKVIDGNTEQNMKEMVFCVKESTRQVEYKIGHGLMEQIIDTLDNEAASFLRKSEVKTDYHDIVDTSVEGAHCLEKEEGDDISEEVEENTDEVESTTEEKDIEPTAENYIISLDELVELETDVKPSVCCMQVVSDETLAGDQGSDEQGASGASSSQKVRQQKSHRLKRDPRTSRPFQHQKVIDMFTFPIAASKAARKYSKLTGRKNLVEIEWDLRYIFEMACDHGSLVKSGYKYYKADDLLQDLVAAKDEDAMKFTKLGYKLY